MFPNWHQAYINNDIFKNQFLKIGFSQNGEDDFVRGYFWDRIINGYQGRYLDIGCGHESLYSNTKLLHLVGWSGIVVDANQGLQEFYHQARPHDKFINLAIVDKSNELKLPVLLPVAGRWSSHFNSILGL